MTKLTYVEEIHLVDKNSGQLKLKNLIAGKLYWARLIARNEKFDSNPAKVSFKPASSSG